MKRRKFLQNISLITITTTFPFIGFAKNGNYSMESINIEPLTNTGLDSIVDVLINHKKLRKNFSIDKLKDSANSVNEMNRLILEGLLAVKGDLKEPLNRDDIKEVNRYLVENYSSVWLKLYEKFYDIYSTVSYMKHLFKNFNGIYQLGFESRYKNRLSNINGDKKERFSKVANWLNILLELDLDSDINDEVINQNISDLNILIPLYSEPYSTAWQRVKEVKLDNPDNDITVIINPNNGEFDSLDEDYYSAILDLSGAGIRVVGYVYTKYGSRDSNEVIANIDNYIKFYKDAGLSGIFFDEASNSIDDFQYYSDLSNNTKSRGLDFIILNPGITTDDIYIDSNIANIVVSYENTHQDLLDNPPSRYNQPTQTTKLSLLIYEMIDNSNSVDDLISFAKEHKFNYIYFTEDGRDGNPWDSISTYFEEEVSKALV